MSWIPDHGVQRAPDPDPQHWITASSNKCNQCGGTGIRDVYPGSDFFPSRIPDPNCLHPGYRILITEFKYFNPKKAKKMVSNI
jgi:hypothetical protein